MKCPMCGHDADVLAMLPETDQLACGDCYGGVENLSDDIHRPEFPADPAGERFARDWAAHQRGAA